MGCAVGDLNRTEHHWYLSSTKHQWYCWGEVPAHSPKETTPTLATVCSLTLPSDTEVSAAVRADYRAVYLLKLWDYSIHPPHTIVLSHLDDRLIDYSFPSQHWLSLLKVVWWWINKGFAILSQTVWQWQVVHMQSIVRKAGRPKLTNSYMAVSEIDNVPYKLSAVCVSLCVSSVF